MGVGGDYERRIASEAKRVAKYSVTLTECNSLLQVFFIFLFLWRAHGKSYSACFKHNQAPIEGGIIYPLASSKIQIKGNLLIVPIPLQT